MAGAIIADEAYRPHPGHYYDEGPYDGPYYYPSDYRGDPREICLQNFRTFQWRTGYYTTYSGERRVCPYLREAALAPDGAPYPYSDARRPPPGADPYGQPFPPRQGAVRPPSATLHSAVPPPQRRFLDKTWTMGDIELVRSVLLDLNWQGAGSALR